MENPSKEQTLLVLFKQAQLSRIRRVIRDALEAAFSDYEQPIGAPGPTSPDAETEDLMAGIGVQTLTKLMREEIQKYKDNIMPPSKTLSRGSVMIDNVDNEIYEDPYQIIDDLGAPPTPPSTGAADQSEHSYIYKRFVPPPLPPRNRGSIKEKETHTDAWDVNTVADTLRVPGQPTDMALNKSIKKLSLELGGNWKALAKALPLAPHPSFVEKRVREIEKAYSGNVEKQTMAMMIEWRMNHGAAADVDALILALRKCGMKDKIKIVEKITQEFTA